MPKLIDQVAETEKVAVSANEGMHERTPSPIRAHKVVLTFISKFRPYLPITWLLNFRTAVRVERATKRTHWLELYCAGERKVSIVGWLSRFNSMGQDLTW